MERTGWSVVLVLVWTASLTMLTWQEFFVAVVVAVPCAVVATKARKAFSGRWKVRAAWLRGPRLLPGAIVIETFTVWRAAFRGRSARGAVHDVQLGHERSEARQAIGVLRLSATPGTVVVDVDRKHNVARVHGFADAEGG